jgi:hypothetical protein
MTHSERVGIVVRKDYTEVYLVYQYQNYRRAILLHAERATQIRLDADVGRNFSF